MAVLYSRVKRTVTTGRNPGTKYLAVLFAPQTVSTRQVAEDIAGATSLAVGDVYNAIVSLCEIIKRYNSNSTRVRLENFGTFAPRISAQAKPTIDEVTDDSIRDVSVLFRPEITLRKKMKSAGVRLRQRDNKGYQDPV
ncbi:MAG: hypothetical protein UHM19_08295 [Bacteroidales bacterium]|nr:hypothetical protein [Bacteroidales bacterium]